MTPFEFRAPDAPREGERQIVVPVGLLTKAELFAFLREAIPLPTYFGGNWDALNDCLGDLAQSPGEWILLIHQDIPLAKTPDDQRTYLQVLADVYKNGPQLQVYFPEAARDEVEKMASI